MKATVWSGWAALGRVEVLPPGECFGCGLSLSVRPGPIVSRIQVIRHATGQLEVIEYQLAAWRVAVARWAGRGGFGWCGRTAVSLHLALNGRPLDLAP